MRCSLLCFFLLWAAPAAAQSPSVRGYYLHLGMGITSGPFTDRNLLDVQRLRLMSDMSVGLLALDAAYEHVLQLSTGSLAGGAGFAGALGTARTGGDWIPLQGSIASGTHAEWRHRFDRLSIEYATDKFALTVGRQPISWATTLFLTPADPFTPFDPSEPFREYRAGVDAARVRFFPGPFTEVEAVVRPAKTAVGNTVTALGRIRAAVGRWEFAGWAGAVHDEASASISATLTVRGAGVRGEGVMRRENGVTIVRAAAGVDRSWNVFGRTLYAVLEYQRDGFAAVDASQLPTVATSAPSLRGELLTLSRHAMAGQISYTLHPLVSVSGLALWSLSDGSVLLAPGLSYSASGAVSLQAGAFAGFGAETSGPFPGSEFGAVPVIGYVALTGFF